MTVHVYHEGFKAEVIFSSPQSDARHNSNNEEDFTENKTREGRNDCYAEYDRIQWLFLIGDN